MKIGIIGINHKSSDLSLRERVAKASLQLFSSPPPNTVLLSTCNRTEIYFSSSDLSQFHSYLLTRLQKEISIPFEHHLYSYFDDQCFHHLALVASGLDSHILAETEIQRQVKIAYENAALQHHLSSDLHYLFQKCLKIGKEVRTQFPISQAATMESIILELSDLVFKEAPISLLLIGNSETNRKLLHYLHNKRPYKITLSTRAPHSAQELQDKYSLQISDWSILPQWDQFDLVISATTQCPHLICANTLKETMRNRLVIDLSVPRNIDPKLSNHPLINLLNIDQISQVVDNRRRHHLHHLHLSRDLVSLSVQKKLDLFLQKKKREGMSAACFPKPLFA